MTLPSAGLLADTRQKSAFTLHIRGGDYTVSQSFSASSEEFLNSFDHSSLPIKKINYLLPAQGAKVEDHSEDAYTEGYTLLVTDYAQLYYAIEGPGQRFSFCHRRRVRQKRAPSLSLNSPRKRMRWHVSLPTTHVWEICAPASRMHSRT